MLTNNQAFYTLQAKLRQLYDEREATAIVHEVLHHITGLDKLRRIMQKDNLLSEIQQMQFEQISLMLQEGKPLQYVTGEAWFTGHRYKVTEDTLIPRPETEELVQWIIGDYRQASAKTILDIGTGTGCISIELKIAMPHSVVTACDISVKALQVAVENAGNLGADLIFKQLDFLDARQTDSLGLFDIIVSNPPYIPESEKAAIHDNVKKYEPAQALFVPDDNALVFYKAIAAFGLKHLNKNGTVYCELHSQLAPATASLFNNAGYLHVEIKRDMHGNERMLKAVYK